MNNENQNNSNVNNPGDLGATALGSVPNPNPTEMPAPPVASPSTQVNPVPPVPEAPVAPVAPAAPTPEPIAPAVDTTVMPAPTEAPVNPTVLESTPTPSAPVENPTAVNNNMNLNPQSVASDVPPVTASPNLATNLGAIEQPIPGTNNYTATSNVNSNAFVEQKQNETIGVEPPAQKDDNKKKPMNKILFVILILALLAGIAYGVYYYLSLGKNKAKVSVTPRDLEVELNGSLSNDIADYATLSGTDAKNCQLNIESVDITNEGVYEYKITCGNDTFTGHVNVVNNALPTAQTKTVYKTITTEGATDLKAEDFIVENTCSSVNCMYAFADSESINTYLANAGTYDVAISVTDGEGKVGTITSKLIVLSTPLKIMMVCSLTNTDGSIVTDRLAIGDDNSFMDFGSRTYVFSFNDQESYNNAIGNKGAELTYNNVSGKAVYDDANLKVEIQSDLTYDILNNDFGNFPRLFSEINNLYTEKGYNCTYES